MPLSNHSFDTYVANKMSQLKIFDVPDIDGFKSNWLERFILDSIFSFNIKKRNKLLLFNYFRCLELIFHEYKNASNFLRLYIDNLEEHLITNYFNSVHYFESVISLCYRCYMLICSLNDNVPLYKKNDGSDIDKINKIYNTSKHQNDRITKSLDFNFKTVPIWLVNDGLESIDENHITVHLSYKELFDYIKSLSEFANEFFDRIHKTYFK